MDGSIGQLTRTRVARSLLAVGLLVLGCSETDLSVHPDVLLITVDTLRADQVGSYGAGSLATPELDRLARSGVVFERAIAAASRTVPAHASIMTSLNTREHSVGHMNGETTLRGSTTLAESFSNAGYRTGGFVGNILLTRGTGLGRGFETFDDALDTPELNRPYVVERRASETTDRAIAWLRERDPRPTFLWVHYQDPHGPYTPPPEDLARFPAPSPGIEAELPIGDSNHGRGVIPPYQALPETHRPSVYVARYKAEIHYADREIGRLIAETEQRKNARPLVVLVTADHGESLGEANFYFMHTHTTTPDVAHVPLILRAPGLTPGRVAGTVGHVDVMPTLLELAGIAIPPDASGVALGPVARGEASLPSRFVYCDIGTQLSAYDDEGFVRAGGLATPWRTEGTVSPDIARAVAQRYRWAPGGPWRAEGRGRMALPAAIAAYARRAEPMVPLPRPDPALHQRLRALGYVDD